MYPSYQDSAINALMGEFIRLASRQADKVMFSDDMVDLSADYTSPVSFSTSQIISIAKMLKEMPTPPGWSESDKQEVYELAAKAEQCQNDDPEHLTHTMMLLLHNMGEYDTGMLSCKMDKEKGVMTVFLEDFLHNPILPSVSKVPVLLDGESHAGFYRLTAATVRYDEELQDWTLTFAARCVNDGRDTELPGNAVDAGLKKMIADFMIEEVHRDPSFGSPLQRFSDGRWFAPRKGLVEVDDTKIPTAITEVTSANILTVEAGTTGYCGGDSGHGSRTYLRIKDDGGTDMRCRVNGYQQRGMKSVEIAKGEKVEIPNEVAEDYETHRANQIEIILGGDCELSTFVTALRFAADVIEKKANGSLMLEVPKTSQED